MLAKSMIIVSKMIVRRIAFVAVFGQSIIGYTVHVTITHSDVLDTVRKILTPTFSGSAFQSRRLLHATSTL